MFTYIKQHEFMDRYNNVFQSSFGEVTMKLKNCPFCDAEVFVFRKLGVELNDCSTENQLCKVACINDCFVMPPRHDIWFRNIAQAIDSANRRPEIIIEEDK